MEDGKCGRKVSNGSKESDQAMVGGRCDWRKTGCGRVNWGIDGRSGKDKGNGEVPSAFDRLRIDCMEDKSDTPFFRRSLG